MIITQSNDMLQKHPVNVVTGHVKWFDPAKGFGFVVSDEGGPDILLHVNVLRNFGQSSVSEGTFIKLAVQETERGIQASEIFEVTPPEGSEENMLEDLEIADIDYSALALEPARVKWFDKGKGFGFANIFGFPEDIFIHMEVLRRSGFADLQPGEALGVRVIEGRRGKMAAQVTAWDVAIREDPLF